MRLHTLRPAEGSNKKARRIGRGQGSGKGGTATRGHKGARARSGFKYKAGFEGGQMPIQRRLPKFGFKNPFRVEYQELNLGQLDAIVMKNPSVKAFNPQNLFELGYVSSRNRKIKLLGKGEIKRPVNITVHHASQKAQSMIAQAGGSISLIDHENAD